MRRHRLATTFLATAGLALGLAACGGSSSTGGTTTTTTSSTTTTAPGATGATGTGATGATGTTGTGATGATGATGTTGTGATGTTGATSTTTLSSSQALSAARAALLTKADMPANWTSTPATKSGGLTHAQEVQIAQCLGVPLADVSSNPPEADSPEFDGPGGLPFVDDGIQVFPSAAVAKHQFSTLTSSKTPQCLTEVFTGPSGVQKSLPAGDTVSKLSTTTIPFATLADGSTALLVRFTVSSQGQSAAFALTLIAVLDGQFGITVEGSNETSPMSPTYLHSLAALNVSRLP